jgi:hypothetical protein
VTTPASPTSTFTGVAGTAYTLRWIISNAPCTASTDDVNITFSQAPTIANAGPDQTGSAMCGVTTATLAANAPAIGTGAWTITSGAGGTVTTPASPTSTFTGVAGTAYTLRWTISNAPCTASTDDVNITFNQAPTAPTVSTSTPNNICPAVIINLTTLVTSSIPTGGSILYKTSNNPLGTNVADPSAVGTGSYYIFYQSQAGCYSSGTLVTATVNSCFKTLNLTSVILQGLYNGGGLMNQANDEYGIHWPTGVADHISVELHNSTNYGTIVYTAYDVPLSTNGTATVSVPAFYNGSYYITIRHRNSLQTVSKTALSFAGSTINQSFGAPANVFGGNLRQMPVGYAIFGGDTNQDDIIDLGDLIPVGNQASMASAGYIPEDVNGDGLVDLSDLLIVGNSASLAIGAITP